MSRGRFNRAAVLGVAVAMLLAAVLIVGNLVTGASAATKSVIVQLKGDPVVVAKAAAEAQGREFDELAYRQQIVNRQDEFLNGLSAAGVQFTVASVDAPNGPNGEVANIAFRFDYIYNGVTLNVPESAIPTIEAMEQVESVQPNSEIELHLDNGVKYTRAPSLYGKPPQVKMGDALQTGGFEGQGINIAILDTGVEWQHPMFGGDPTPPQFGVGPSMANSNRKVTYYMNYTAGAVTDDFGHGSHVAGIAAGYLSEAPGPDGLPLTGDEVKIHGVAPQAKIMGYKVLSTVGSGQAASIIMAMEDAVRPFTLTGAAKPVAHVINMSLGDTSNNPNGATSVAADNATLAGTTVVASAGNSGRPTPTNPTGEGTIGAPGAGRRVLTVGANLDPGSAPNKLDEIGGENRKDMKIFPLEGGAPILSDITANYVFCAWAETPDQVPDSVRGKIALIERGGSVNTPPESPVAAGTGLFSNKAAFAVAKGAIAVIVYNNVDGELTAATARKSTVPVVGLSKANGEYLKKAIGSTAFGAVSANQIRINKALIFEPDMADFSSKGMVNGFGMIKPDVTAPGVSVLSATVRVGGVATNTSTMFDPTGYISASGTSMSSPMTAGVVALVKQKNPTWTPSMIRAAVMNTATNLRRADGTPVADGTQTLNQQGAGLVDAFAAANAKALMGTGQIDMTEGEPAARSHGVFVQTSPGNPDFLGSHSFGAVPVAGVIGTAAKSQAVTITDIREGAGAGVYRLSSSAVRNVPAGVTVSFTNAAGEPVSEVEVPANGSASFSVNVSVNGESVPADPTQIEWYVTAARADGGQTLRMPFQFRAVRPTFTAVAPTMGAVSGNEFAGNPPTDIDGSYQLSYGYASTPAPAKFRVQESGNNGATWATLADVPSAQTAFNVAGRGNGAYQYRVVGLFPVEHGLIEGPASAARAVVVDRRVGADVTSLVQWAMVDNTVSLAGGVFQYDQTLKNVSNTDVFAPLRFTITSISSRSGKVKVTNADNSGDGVSTPAEFGYTAQAGADQKLAAGETSAARRLQFANPVGEMFDVSVAIHGHMPDTANASGTSSAGGTNGGTASAGTTSGGGSTAGGTTVGGTLQQTTTTVMRFTINPLTGSVTRIR
ncbi:MAG TPA: S8 family serine peptidase [Pyrinomonadaceae bacterium]|nr:S8 family serine peptidase [Pyrinomonadaceae bacterium]